MCGFTSPHPEMDFSGTLQPYQNGLQIGEAFKTSDLQQSNA